MVSEMDPIIYADERLPVYLDDAASGKPAPGGGSVSACVGALGAALTSMVCNLTIGKEQFAAVEPRMREVLAASEAARARLQQLLQDDTTAYSGVLVAYRLPKDTAEEKAARHQAVQDGLIVAAEVPLQICRVAVEVSRLAKVAAELGNANAVTDAGIGALLGEAGAVGAALNVRINLGSIEDQAYVRRTSAELDELLAEAATLRADVLATTLAKI
jgi:formiminotetrahydrofolate cyclodeaminase